MTHVKHVFSLLSLSLAQTHTEFIEEPKNIAIPKYSIVLHGYTTFAKEQFWSVKSCAKYSSKQNALGAPH